MIKNIIKIIFTILGIGILVSGIITEIDGIGRFAIILFGTIFSIIGSVIQVKKKDLKEN